MPVQDEEKIPITEEMDETHKSEAIMPVINAIYDIYSDRIDDLQKDKAEINDRISACHDKIASLSETADRLSATNEMLTQLMNEHKIPKAAGAVIAVNQAKINRIRDTQIPKLENSSSRDAMQIEKLDKRIETVSLKAERMKHLSGVIKSFTILNPAKRREQFSFHMDGMRACSNKLLESKITAETEKLNNLHERYEKTDSAVEKYNLTDKISKQTNLVRDLKAKLNENVKPLSEIESQQLDKVIAETEKNLEKLADSETIDFEAVPETVLNDSTAYLKNAEMSMEDDFNMIDGIINNGSKESKEELETKRDELVNAIESMQSFAESPYISQELRDMTLKNIENSKKELEAVASALAVFSVSDEKENIEKINPDFYQTISYDDRRIETMNNAQADKVIKMLENAGIMFSAAKHEHSTSVTVYKTDQRLFKEIIDKAHQEVEQESKQAWRELGDAYVEAYEERKMPDKSESKTPAPRKKSKLTNPEVYNSIPQDQRVINNFPKKVALRIMDELENKGIPYSALEKGNDVVAITVSKENETTFKTAENTAKTEHLRYVHPEVYHQIPKDERHVQHMSENDVKSAISQLEKDKIPYSAVVNGDKSAVTVNKAHAPKIATLSRKQMHEQAEALRREQRSQPKQKIKNNNMEL